jgi:release factor glutamine methyltransferase
MCSVVRLSGRETVLEVGCGCGAVTLVLSQKCRFVQGVDVNPLAVENAQHNATALSVTNARFLVSDVFEKVEGQFDVIVCNPPYNKSGIADPIERMFWDPNDDAKVRFFAGLRDHLRDTGRVYFGWANFADLDSTLPLRLAAEAGLRYVRHYSAAAPNGPYCFYVIELRPNRSVAD